MIAKGNTHNDGAKLASYMTTAKEGERVELAPLQGFEATNIKDAFRDVEVMAAATKCKKPFFHVQVRNPKGEKLSREQWERVADRIESKLGLSHQPRASVFHINEKTGDEHMHVAWSRIDQDQMKAIPLPFFKYRLKEVCRELEIEMGLTRVKNERDGPVLAPKRDEYEQAKRLGVNIHDVRKTIRDCYDRSDCGRGFEAALADKGLLLAQGDRRDFIVIDAQGGMHALGKRILGVSASKIRDRLSDLAREHLPGVDQIRAHLVEQQLSRNTHDLAVNQKKYDEISSLGDRLKKPNAKPQDREPWVNDIEAVKERMDAFGFDARKSVTVEKWEELAGKVDDGRITEKDRMRQMDLYLWHDEDKDRRQSRAKEERLQRKTPEEKNRDFDRDQR
jgi:hypothetical protein